MIALDDATLLRYTGQTAYRAPADVQLLVADASRAVAAAKARHDQAASRVGAARLRRVLVKVGPTWVLAVVAASVVSVPPCLLIGLGSLGAAGAALMLPLVFGLAFGGTFLLLRYEPGETDANRVAVRTAIFIQAKAALAAAALCLAPAQARLDELSALYSKLEAAAADPVRHLLAVDCSGLDGTAFERYLAAIFRLHGYQVQETGQSGDQGVDLVVAKGEVRVAVQAKCYSSAVGNYAVQEVYAGMAHWRCHRCVVITNNTFTAGARALAVSTGCFLIEGGQLPLLIRGTIKL